jgi:hypothetical protein
MRETFSGMPSVESDQDDTSTSPLDEMRTTLWIAQCPFRVCAVQRRRFPVGENPTRQSLQPEAIGAVMEVTKWLNTPSNPRKGQCAGRPDNPIGED